LKIIFFSPLDYGSESFFLKKEREEQRREKRKERQRPKEPITHPSKEEKEAR